MDNNRKLQTGNCSIVGWLTSVEFYLNSHKFQLALESILDSSVFIIQLKFMKEHQEEKKTPSLLETYGYKLKKTVGNGSYATVKLAYSDRYSGYVAVKIIDKFLTPPDYINKFLIREIQVVKNLKHSHIIRFLQVMDTTHKVYIIMEYAENGSLLERIRHDSYITEDQSRKWFQQLVSAIEYCHNVGVVHRDIKCENLLLNHHNDLKLIDFGFARNDMISKSGRSLYSCTFCGSFAYASPEILKGIPYQPQYADIWAMGVVLFAMVYGILPFNDSNYSNLVKLVSRKITFPKKPIVSTSCQLLITKILAPLKKRIKIDGIKNAEWMLK